MQSSSELQPDEAPPRDRPVPEPRLPRFTGWLRPLVDAVARIRASIHAKLLFGFLTGAALLMAMAALSLVVIGQMNDRMEVLNAQATKVVLGAALDRGCDPVVHISSSVALMRHGGSGPDLPLGDIDHAYSRSKAISEEVAREFQAAGKPS